MGKVPEKYFNTKALTERWLCSTNTIYNYVKKDSIPYIRTPGGRTLLFPVDAIFEYEQSLLSSRQYVNKKPKKKKKTLSAQNREWRAE
jgi:hypothetical protein